MQWCYKYFSTSEELAPKETICVWVLFPDTDGEAFSPERAAAEQRFSEIYHPPI